MELKKKRSSSVLYKFVAQVSTIKFKFKFKFNDVLCPCTARLPCAPKQHGGRHSNTTS